MIEELILAIQKGEDLRRSLSSLRAAIKEEDNKKQAQELLGDADLIAGLLKEDDPKVRKNAAALLGDLGAKEQAEALYQGYEREEQRFIREAYVKALKKTNPGPYLPMLKEKYDALKNYHPGEEEKKHVAEELRALEEILRQEGEFGGHTFLGWNKKLFILLTTMPGYGEVTGEKILSPSKKYNSLGVMGEVENLREVVKLRTFRELLFPLSLKDAITIESEPEELCAG